MKVLALDLEGTLISNAISVFLRPGILVDDHQSYVHPDQISHWLEIAEYSSPYSKEDNELEDLRLRLARRLGSD